MKGILFWTASILLVAVALTAAISMATVRWLYPRAQQEPEAAPAPSAAAASAPVLITQAPVGTAERRAIDLIRLAAAGNLNGALQIAPGLSKALLTEQVTHLNPTPLKAWPLPSAEGGPLRTLVWTQYRREGLTTRGAYVVETSGDQITNLRGPLAPQGGYRPLPFQPFDERARPVRMSLYAGRGLVLVSPRAPEPGLVETIAHLQQQLAPQGVDVILVLDTRAPDWAGVARAGGFTGSVWRVKQRMEDIPVVTPGLFHGSVGLLVDRSGLVVASLTVLDPGRYGLTEQPVEAIAPTVLRAYGLLP